MKYIQLNKGMQAIVDDDLYDWLNQWEWYAKLNVTNGKYYAARTLNGTNGKNRTLYMHQLIQPAGVGFEVDHEDTNSLNDQRQNLRVGTKAQNQWNRLMQKNNTSGMKGISWHKRDEQYRVQVRINSGKRIVKGFPADKLDEAIAFRNAMYEKYHKEFSNGVSDD